MHGVLLGMETELAFSAWNDAGGAAGVDRDELLAELFSLAAERIPSLPDGQGAGLFLSNGARLYLDSGSHPELCTPECQSPVEVVRWQIASERLLAALTAELEKRHPGLRMALLRCNVDYSGSGNTWGCHESYQHRRSCEEMAPHLIPHLVTRLVYAGAGGFDNTRNGLHFLLSPRVPHLIHEIGADSTGERGIYHTRNEPLSAGGFGRLHVLCGESLCSELANALKLGATALVVRLVDTGVCRGRELAFRDAPAAMRAFARDPACRARAELVDGRCMTATEVQAEYLAMVEEQLESEWMPAWAPELCRRWRAVLEQLVSDPEALATSLDWAIKHALFRDRAGRAGAPWSELRRGNGPGAELCEIDTRFGELSERALFHALDLAGALDHRWPDLGPVEDAMADPPPGARAEARGRAIQELHGERHRYRCAWDAIHDRQEPRILDLSDPFGTSPEWRQVETRPSAPPPDSPSRRIDRSIARGVDQYQQMDLERAVATLEASVFESVLGGDREQQGTARFWCATAHHDAGNLDAADRALAPELEAEGVSPPTRIRLLTRHALVQIERPALLADAERAIAGARSACRSARGRMGLSRVGLLEARLLGARGRYPEAIEAMERALSETSSDPIAFARGSYLRWLVAYLVRTDQQGRAQTHLERWREQIGPDGLVSYAGVSLAIAESELALRAGRHAQALEHARRALEHSGAFRRHRCRLAACIAFLQAAAAARELEGADGILEEALRWRGIQLGELKLHLLTAEALVHQARAVPAAQGPRRRGPAAHRLRSARLWRSARREACALDSRLESDHHACELEEML